MLWWGLILVIWINLWSFKFYHNIITSNNGTQHPQLLNKTTSTICHFRFHILIAMREAKNNKILKEYRKTMKRDATWVLWWGLILVILINLWSFKFYHNIIISDNGTQHPQLLNKTTSTICHFHILIAMREVKNNKILQDTTKKDEKRCNIDTVVILQ